MCARPMNGKTAAFLFPWCRSVGHVFQAAEPRPAASKWGHGELFLLLVCFLVQFLVVRYATSRVGGGDPKTATVVVQSIKTVWGGRW